MARTKIDPTVAVDVLRLMRFPQLISSSARHPHPFPLPRWRERVKKLSVMNFTTALVERIEELRIVEEDFIRER